MARKSKTKTATIVILGVIAAGLLGFATYTHFAKPKVTVDTAYHPKAPESTPVQPAAQTSTKPAPAPTPIPPSTAPQASPSGKTTVSAPTTGSTVADGTKVTGQAPGGTQLYYRVKGKQSGQVAYSGPITIAGNADTMQSFSFDLAFTNGVSGPPDNGSLEVFTLTNQTETNIATVQVYIR
jgi:biotin carboxyl carrier protein